MEAKVVRRLVCHTKHLMLLNAALSAGEHGLAKSVLQCLWFTPAPCRLLRQHCLIHQKILLP